VPISGAADFTGFDRPGLGIFGGVRVANR